MNHFRRSHIAGVVGTALLCAAWTAHAQESTTNAATGNSSGVALGPPQIRDFQLEPKQRIPAPQPQPQAQPPAQEIQRPAAEPARTSGGVEPQRRPQAQPEPSRGEQPRTEAPAPAVQPGDPITADQVPTPTFEAPRADAPETVEPVAAETEGEGASWWLYLIPIAVLALAGLAWRRRRKRQSEETEEAPVPSVAPAAAAPRREPVPRPWLELELQAERASFTDTEWVVNFRLEVSNTGKSIARNLRIDVKLFNAGSEQDKEIGAFFRTAGRETTKLKLPGIPAGQKGLINGEVAMPLAEMRAMKVSDRSLFIPVVAVNILYDWGEGRTGQTARSYLVGRELQEPSEKMGAFRIDLGPRVWRTVGQRPHKLARRV